MSKAVDNPRCWPQQPVDNRLPPVENHALPPLLGPIPRHPGIRPIDRVCL